jgi:tungstate transport system substrate-binding protein
LSTVAVLTSFIGSGCNRQPLLVLATTSSVAQSGLLDPIGRAYEAEVGMPIRVVQVGSGRALVLLANATADAAITHAPEGEAAALDVHPTWFYRKVLYNRFVLVGPERDPAGIAGMTDVVQAMARVAQSGERFISRGDESGTHERERQLWGRAGVTPIGDRLVVAGAAMGQTLRIADQMDAYTLTDEGTLAALGSVVRLRVHVSGDPRLLNTYAVLADPANNHGLHLARWFVEGSGRQVVHDVLTRGEVVGFVLWPLGTPSDHPAALPNGGP